MAASLPTPGPSTKNTLSMSPKAPIIAPSKDVECPVCLEFLTTPIKLCERGHSICGKCSDMMNKCPLCNGFITQIRNFVLESILPNVKFPCTYHEQGCDFDVKLSELLKHEASCDERPGRCYLSKNIPCEWTGFASRRFDHIKKCHSNFLNLVEDTKNLVLDLNVYEEEKPYFQIVGCNDYDVYLIMIKVTPRKILWDGFLFGYFETNEESVDNAYKIRIKHNKYPEKDLVLNAYFKTVNICDRKQILSDSLNDLECCVYSNRFLQEYYSQTGAISCEVDYQRTYKRYILFKKNIYNELFLIN